MATLSEVFRSIHRLRKLARDFQAEIDRGPIQLKARGAFAAKQAAALQAAKDAVKKKQVDVRDLEVTLKATHQLTAKYEKQQNEVSDSKAFEALTHEIATSKAKADELEDAILTGMGVAEELAAGLPVLEAAAKKAKAEFEGFDAELKTKHVRLADDLKTTLAELKVAELDIPNEVRPDYNRKLAAMGAECLAAAENGVCGFCRTGMTAHQVNQIQMGMFIVCTSCHRPLYLLEELRADNQESVVQLPKKKRSAVKPEKPVFPAKELLENDHVPDADPDVRADFEEFVRIVLVVIPDCLAKNRGGKIDWVFMPPGFEDNQYDEKNLATAWLNKSKLSVEISREKSDYVRGQKENYSNRLRERLEELRSLAAKQ